MSRQEIETIAADFAKAFANQDAEAVSGFYAADATLLPPNALLLKGRAAIRSFVEEMFSSGARSLELTTLDVLAGGDLEVEVGRFRMAFQPRGVDPFTEDGKYVAVYRRQGDGSLKLAVDTFNSDAPAS